MLVLSRQREESIIIRVPGQPEIVVSILDIRSDRVCIGVQAARHITVNRHEVDAREMAVAS